MATKEEVLNVVKKMIIEEVVRHPPHCLREWDRVRYSELKSFIPNCEIGETNYKFAKHFRLDVIIDELSGDIVGVDIPQSLLKRLKIA
jgi:hypothetical protein